MVRARGTPPVEETKVVIVPAGVIFRIVLPS
jgi:hypothetical protein